MGLAGLANTLGCVTEDGARREGKRGFENQILRGREQICREQICFCILSLPKRWCSAENMICFCFLSLPKRWCTIMHTSQTHSTTPCTSLVGIMVSSSRPSPHQGQRTAGPHSLLSCRDAERPGHTAPERRRAPDAERDHGVTAATPSFAGPFQGAEHKKFSRCVVPTALRPDPGLRLRPAATAR